MAFRADEAAQAGRERVEAYLVPKPSEATRNERERCKDILFDIVTELGPAIDSYPTWHPLVCNHDRRWPITIPDKRCQYKGLDHTKYFANGFITCPYGDGQEVIDSVEALPDHFSATLSAERLDANFYHPDTTPVLVRCSWNRPLLHDGTIPLSLAMPLILEREMPCWRWSEVGETWETMRPYFLGMPHGSRSSLFVNQETGQAIKKIWNSLINTGMFGPIMVDRT